MDADLSAELVLVDLLNKEGAILSKNWFYSTDFRVFNLQWFYQIGLLISPANWNIARAVGMGLFYIVFFFAALCFAKNCELKGNEIWFAGTLLWPIGFQYHFLGTWGGYYLVFALFSLIDLHCIQKISNAPGTTILTKQYTAPLLWGRIICVLFRIKRHEADADFLLSHSSGIRIADIHFCRAQSAFSTG